MGVRCEKCGHQNDGKFLFCGMCGQRLPSVQWQDPTPARPPVKAPPGLLFPAENSEDAAERASYLLKDDEETHPRHTGRLYLALVFLVISLVLLAIHWRPYAHSWLSQYVARSAATSPGENEAAPDAGSANSSPAPVANDSAKAPSKPATTPAPPPAPPAAPQSKEPPPQTAENTGDTSSVPTSATPASVPPASSAPPPKDTESNSGAASTDTTSSSTSSPAKPADSQPDASSATPPPEVQSPQSQTPQATPPPGESLVTQGERYLYGNGVLQDCALARKKLSTAAERQNARALTLLGTMYATGHCAPRDLPTAYGWFARALRVDPNNHRLDDDLSLIWKQMTPGEKQLALKK